MAIQPIPISRITILVAVSVLLILGGVFFFADRRASPSAAVQADREASPSDALQTDLDTNPVAPATETESWAEGPFTALADTDIRADLDRFLMIEMLAAFPPGAEEALRAKLTLFLGAYSDTLFDKYAKFRSPQSVCRLDDARIKPTMDAWSPQLGPRPDQSLQIVGAPWAKYVVEGMGPIRPGPIIDAVNWSHCRATLRSLKKRELVEAEWDEMMPIEGRLYKEHSGARADSVPPAAMRSAVPNAISPMQVADRDGIVVYCDFDIATQAQGLDPRRLVLRFYWDAVARTWLPLHAMVIGGSPAKPFFW